MRIPVRTSWWGRLWGRSGSPWVKRLRERGRFAPLHLHIADQLASERPLGEEKFHASPEFGISWGPAKTPNEHHHLLEMRFSAHSEHDWMSLPLRRTATAVCWVQHIPRAKQHLVTYAGWFANALGKLKVKESSEATLENPKSNQWVKWRTLILRCWAVDPELCPRCHQEMKRAKALLQQHELQRLLKNLGIGLYPVRPRSPPPPNLNQGLAEESHFSDPDSQVPPDWEDWAAA